MYFTFECSAILELHTYDLKYFKIFIKNYLIAILYILFISELLIWYDGWI